MVGQLSNPPLDNNMWERLLIVLCRLDNLYARPSYLAELIMKRISFIKRRKKITYTTISPSACCPCSRGVSAAQLQEINLCDTERFASRIFSRSDIATTPLPQSSIPMPVWSSPPTYCLSQVLVLIPVIDIHRSAIIYRHRRKVSTRVRSGDFLNGLKPRWFMSVCDAHGGQLYRRSAASVHLKGTAS